MSSHQEMTDESCIKPIANDKGLFAVLLKVYHIVPEKVTRILVSFLLFTAWGRTAVTIHSPGAYSFVGCES